MLVILSVIFFSLNRYINVTFCPVTCMFCVMINNFTFFLVTWFSLKKQNDFQIASDLFCLVVTKLFHFWCPQKRSYILMWACSWRLQVSISLCDLFVDTKTSSTSFFLDKIFKSPSVKWPWIIFWLSSFISILSFIMLKNVQPHFQNF